MGWPMDAIEHDSEDRADAEPRAWEVHSDRWCAPIPERTTATVSLGKAVLIIGALSTLAWGVVILAVIWVFSDL
jgi:hypothetical protein